MNSLKKAISYSLKPHELGYCGPTCADESKEILKKYLRGENIDERKIISLLNDFLGAVSYYNLIAKKNNIKDIYDYRVIEAYWIGNELLDNVNIFDIKEMVLNDFVAPNLLTKDRAKEIVNNFPHKAYAHHTFHIFFVGAITKKVKLEGKLKDECRPSWAEVIDTKEDKALVKMTRLFPEISDVNVEVVWDKMFIPVLNIGDNVTCHWGRISEKINNIELDNLKKYTMLNYRAIKNK
jgi:hypothetical protein